MERKASIVRNTSETKIKVSINLDGKGSYHIDTGIPFFDHMIQQIGRHALIDLDISCVGDLEIDFHHTVEDVGICLGQAFSKALGDKSGIKRFGDAYAPLDEALSRTVIDISGRPSLYYNVIFTKEKIGNFDSELIHEFFQGFVNHAFVTVHIDNLKGENSHHQAESIFKSFAVALREAIELDSRKKNIIPSTKGSL